MKERLKKRCKQCNATFGKGKIKLINKIKYHEQGELIQIFIKDKIECAIIKKNIGRFELAYLLPLLEGDFCKELVISEEGKLSEDIL